MDADEIRNSRMIGCMEAIEYYACTIIDLGRKLNPAQEKDYREKCSIMQVMGAEAKEYADTMLALL